LKQDQEKDKLKISLVAKGLTQNYEGSVDEVITYTFEFLHKLYPSFRFATMFIQTPNYVELSEKLTKYLKVSENGNLFFVRQPDSTNQTIGMLLLGAMIAHKMKILDKGSLSLNQFLKATSKAPKTIRNSIATLVKKDLIDRISKGEYIITESGLIWIEKILEEGHKDLKGE
jgi:hypothetical protein